MGIITFIGAGPGDPDLITLKAQRLIAAADVLIYAGSLVNPAILDHARPDAVRYDSAGMPLDAQIAVMSDAARRGLSVARLHTGDPALYGAISEQMRALDRAGVPYRIVPGVSAAFAATAALGIELTLPGSTQTAIFTRLAGRTPVPEAERLRDLAAHRTSLILFLSTGMVASVVEELAAAGYAPQTPVAVVFRASWPDERILRGTLADIAAQVEAAEITHHALIVISPALDETTAAHAPDSHLYGAAFDRPPQRKGPAIISLTRQGTATARRLLNRMPDATLYAPARFADAAPHVEPYTTSIRQVLHTAFQTHSALICVMASGIAVRELAPLLRSKHDDPAVIVLDGAGRYAIPLLGGHGGGANALARDVAALLDAQAVLTTASDVQGLPAVDLLGEQFGWQLEDGAALTALSATLVNGEPVGVLQDAGTTAWLPDPPPPNVTLCTSFEALRELAPAATLVISPRFVPDAVRAAVPQTVVYRPACLVIGVGCNRGTPAAEIEAAILHTLDEAGLSPASIAALATIEDKSDEPGLLELCRAGSWPLRILGREAIRTVDPPTPSPAAHTALGVWGVAEPAALLAAGTPSLLVEKRRFRNVTVAVAQEDES